MLLARPVTATVRLVVVAGAHALDRLLWPLTRHVVRVGLGRAIGEYELSLEVPDPAGGTCRRRAGVGVAATLERRADVVDLPQRGRAVRWSAWRERDLGRDHTPVVRDVRHAMDHR